MRWFARVAVGLLVVLTLLPLPISATPTNLTDLLSEADRLYDRREDMANVRQSIEMLEAWLENSPHEYGVLWRLARAYEWVGRYAASGDQVGLFADAVAYAERAVETQPEGVEGRYWYALTIGRLGEARGILRSLSAASDMRRELETVLELAPDHAGAHFALGMLYHRLPGWPLSFGDNNRALELMSAAVELAPDNTTYRLGLAELLLDLRRRDDAISQLETIIEMPLTPDEPVESAEDKIKAQALIERYRPNR